MAIPFFRRLFGHAPSAKIRVGGGEAAKEEAETRFELGLKYAKGLGETQDFTAAAQCFRESADRNYAPAQFNLGMLYVEGQGVPKDDAQAVLWIDKAAQQGNPDAQFNLGMRHYRNVICSRSNDLPESRIEAYKWLRLAAAQDFPDSEVVCDRITLAMSHSEVDDGNQRAAGFLAEHMSPSRFAL